ncbi:hypothetical protein KC315_g14053, partial [Hortaea werneckii]
MSQPTSPGQVIDPFFTRRPSTGLAKPSRQNSAASEKMQDVGLDRRGQGHRLAGAQPAVVKRKQLPWLAKKEGKDIEIGQGVAGVPKQNGLGNPQGAAPSTAPAETASLNDNREPKTSDTAMPSSAKRPSITSLGHNMSVRAVGSTRSMDQGEKQVRPQRSLSLGAELRPGVKPLRSKHQAKQAFGLEKNKKIDLEDYTASEYSTTVSSSDVEHPPTIPITTPVSSNRTVHQPISRRQVDLTHYQRQVQKAADRKEHLSRHEPGPSLKQQWTKGRLPPSHAELAPGAVKLTSTDASNSPRNIAPKNTVKPSPIPRHPPPIATTSHDLRRETRKMDTAIRDHEKLMDKAFGAADEAAGRGHSNEVARILEGASSALHNASTTALYRRSTTRPINSPLRLSPSESGLSTDGELSDDHDLWDLQHSRENSTETVPTLVTASSSKSPLLAAPYTKDGKQPVPRRASMHSGSSAEDVSIAPTPPGLYQPPSVESIVRDFAYTDIQSAKARSLASLAAKKSFGAAADFYNDQGESVAYQPGVRKSMNPPLPDLPAEERPSSGQKQKHQKPAKPARPLHGTSPKQLELRELEHVPTSSEPPKVAVDDNVTPNGTRHPHKRGRNHPHVSDFFESSYYRHPNVNPTEAARKLSSVTDTRSVPKAPPPPPPQDPPLLLRERTRRPGEDDHDAKYV